MPAAQEFSSNGRKKVHVSGMRNFQENLHRSWPRSQPQNCGPILWLDRLFRLRTLKFPHNAHDDPLLSSFREVGVHREAEHDIRQF